MGTRGLVVVKYRKKYYSCYNHCDSYPDHLGRKFFDEIVNCDISKKSRDSILSIADDYPEELKKTDVEPSTDLFIEWVYLIDLL